MTRAVRALVTGGTGRVGTAIVHRLEADGARVVAAGRRDGDLARPHEARALVERAAAELGGLDLLVYAAGIMHLPAEGEYDFARDRAEIEVNLVGAMAWTTPVAALFEARRSGTIVGISSIAGERGRRTFPAYSTSKAGLTTWLEALRNRAARSGVNVVTVKPGFVDTAMTAALTRKPMVIPVERAAALILAAARRGGSPSVFIPGTWWPVAMVLRHLPSFVFRRLDL